MVHTFIKTCIGYSHIKSRKVCQDSTSLYQDRHRTIITCCDGHGGDIYVRSSVGSSLASKAITNVFSDITPNELNYLSKTKFENKIKLLILCEWNKLVEEFISKAPLTKSETKGLKEEDIQTLKHNQVKAYGTTLTGALLLDDKLLLVGIGDSEVMLINDGTIKRAFDEDDDPVGNITYSMCQEDAYNYLRVKLVDFKDYDGILLCTDGLSSPYQSYDNFNDSFVKPVISKILDEGNTKYIDSFIEQIALKLGVGDDVSLAMILNEKDHKKFKLTKPKKNESNYHTKTIPTVKEETKPEEDHNITPLESNSKSVYPNDFIPISDEVNSKQV